MFYRSSVTVSLLDFLGLPGPLVIFSKPCQCLTWYLFLIHLMYMPSHCSLIFLRTTSLYRRFPDNHFPGQVVSRTRRFPDKVFPGQGVSRTRPFPNSHFPGQTFPGQVILRNFQVHNVCKYQIYRPSQTICVYTERLLMCACRPALSILGLFGKSCSPTMGKA